MVLLGGSIGVQGGMLDRVAKAIKDEIEVPLVIFPGNIGTITTNVDAIYFMSLLNSRNPYWITQAQMLAAPVIKKSGIEPLPVGYIVVQPGGTVGLGRRHQLRAQGEADDRGGAGDSGRVHGQQDNNHGHRVEPAGAGFRACAEGDDKGRQVVHNRSLRRRRRDKGHDAAQGGLLGGRRHSPDRQRVREPGRRLQEGALVLKGSEGGGKKKVGR